jgi:hypothetical protein
MFKKLFPVIVTLAVSSCTSLSNQGANVMLLDTNSQLPKDCSFIKYVESASAQDDFSSSIAVAKIRLRNEAGETSANYVVITKTNEGVFIGSAVVGGKAYICEV